MSAIHAAEPLHVLISAGAGPTHPLPSSTNSPQDEFKGYIAPDSSLNSFRGRQLQKSSSSTPQMKFSKGVLVVYSYSPTYGPPGTQLTAYVGFTKLSGINVQLRVVFGDLALPTSVTPTANRVQGQENGKWTLRITIPPTNQAAVKVPPSNVGVLEWILTLQALDPSDNLLDDIAFGLFSYEEPLPNQGGCSIQMRPSFDNDVPSRHLSTTSEVQTYMTASQIPSPPSVRRFSKSSLAALISNTEITISPHLFPQTLGAQSLPTKACSSHRSYPGPSYSYDFPALIPTSRLGWADPTKFEQVIVALKDGLESIKHSWSETERRNGRRLVQFWKQQVGTTLQISFAAIPQSAYKDSLIVISCISCENIDDYYITSNDAIRLLEGLAGRRFDVEEKNQTRRKLAGFKPIVVSKSKAGTERLFWSIMAFPAPRPRNIQTDMKVFKWGTLKSMLERFFSTYSIQSPPPKREPSDFPQMYCKL